MNECGLYTCAADYKRVGDTAFNTGNYLEARRMYQFALNLEKSPAIFRNHALATLKAIQANLVHTNSIQGWLLSTETDLEQVNFMQPGDAKTAFSLISKKASRLD